MTWMLEWPALLITPLFCGSLEPVVLWAFFSIKYNFIYSLVHLEMGVFLLPTAQSILIHTLQTRSEKEKEAIRALGC